MAMTRGYSFLRTNVKARSNGHTAIGVVSYCCGLAATSSLPGLDGRAKASDYTGRTDILATGYAAPLGTDGSWGDPITWAQRIEAVDKRKNSRQCREDVVAIPIELVDAGLADAVVQEYARRLAVLHNTVVHWALHGPDRGGVNYHGHALYPGRHVDGLGFSRHRDREQDNPKNPGDPDLVTRHKAVWSEICGGQGIELVWSSEAPTHHLGPRICATKRRRMVTEVGDRIRDTVVASETGQPVPDRRTLNDVAEIASGVNEGMSVNAMLQIELAAAKQGVPAPRSVPTPVACQPEVLPMRRTAPQVLPPLARQPEVLPRACEPEVVPPARTVATVLPPTRVAPAVVPPVRRAPEVLPAEVTTPAVLPPIPRVPEVLLPPTAAPEVVPPARTVGSVLPPIRNAPAVQPPVRRSPEVLPPVQTVRVPRPTRSVAEVPPPVQRTSETASFSQKAYPERKQGIVANIVSGVKQELPQESSATWTAVEAFLRENGKSVLVGYARAAATKLSADARRQEEGSSVAPVTEPGRIRKLADLLIDVAVTVLEYLGLKAKGDASAARRGASTTEAGQPRALSSPQDGTRASVQSGRDRTPLLLHLPGHLQVHALPHVDGCLAESDESILELKAMLNNRDETDELARVGLDLLAALHQHDAAERADAERELHWREINLALRAEERRLGKNDGWKPRRLRKATVEVSDSRREEIEREEIRKSHPATVEKIRSVCGRRLGLVPVDPAPQAPPSASSSQQEPGWQVQRSGRSGR